MGLFYTKSRTAKCLTASRSRRFLLALLFCAVSFYTSSAQAQNRVLEGFSIFAPTNPATLDTRAPGKEADIFVSASASVPQGEVTWEHGGFTFYWPADAAIVKKKRNAANTVWEDAPAGSAVTLTPPPAQIDPYFPGMDGTKTVQAKLTASFPSAGTYLIQVSMSGKWNAGTNADFVSAVKTLDIIMKVATTEVTFTEGLVSYPNATEKKLRMCAGAVADDDVHSGAAIVEVKRNGTVLGGASIEFSLDTTGINYSAVGIIAPKVLRAYNGAQTVQADATGKIKIATGTDGKVTVRVLSSNLISQPKLAVRMDNTEIGSVKCDFASAEKLRRFPNWTDPGESGDSGWLFTAPHLDEPDRTTPAKLYLKFQVDVSRGDVDGNWKFVNGHRLLIKVDSVDLQQDAGPFSGVLSDYGNVVNPNDAQATTRTVLTGENPNDEGVFDGAAQVTVKAGQKISDVATVWFNATDLDQRDN